MGGRGCCFSLAPQGLQAWLPAFLLAGWQGLSPHNSLPVLASPFVPRFPLGKMLPCLFRAIDLGKTHFCLLKEFIIIQASLGPRTLILRATTTKDSEFLFNNNKKGYLGVIQRPCIFELLSPQKCGVCVRACVIRIMNRQRKLQYFSTSSFPGIKCLVQITFLKKKKRLLFNYAYVYVYGFCICVQVPVRPKTAIPFPEARVTGNCESPGISGRN